MATAFDKIREKEKENRRRAIAGLAEQILQDQGMEAVTIRKVAQAAGLSTGAIYMYFKNKEELFIHLLLENLDILEKNLEKSMGLSGAATVFSAMANDYKAYYLRFGKYIDFFTLIQEKESGDDMLDPTLMDSIRSKLLGLLARLGTMLDRPDMKPLLKGVPPDRAVPVLWSVITGLAHVTLPSPRSREAGFDFDRVLEDAMVIMLG